MRLSTLGQIREQNLLEYPLEKLEGMAAVMGFCVIVLWFVSWILFLAVVSYLPVDKMVKTAYYTVFTIYSSLIIFSFAFHRLSYCMYLTPNEMPKQYNKINRLVLIMPALLSAITIALFEYFNGLNYQKLIDITTFVTGAWISFLFTLTYAVPAHSRYSGKVRKTSYWSLIQIVICFGIYLYLYPKIIKWSGGSINFFYIDVEYLCFGAVVGLCLYPLLRKHVFYHDDFNLQNNISSQVQFMRSAINVHMTFFAFQIFWHFMEKLRNNKADIYKMLKYYLHNENPRTTVKATNNGVIILGEHNELPPFGLGTKMLRTSDVINPVKPPKGLSKKTTRLLKEINAGREVMTTFSVLSLSNVSLDTLFDTPVQTPKNLLPVVDWLFVMAGNHSGKTTVSNISTDDEENDCLWSSASRPFFAIVSCKEHSKALFEIGIPNVVLHDKSASILIRALFLEFIDNAIGEQKSELATIWDDFMTLPVFTLNKRLVNRFGWVDSDVPTPRQQKKALQRLNSLAEKFTLPENYPETDYAKTIKTMMAETPPRPATNTPSRPAADTSLDSVFDNVFARMNL